MSRAACYFKVERVQDQQRYATIVIQTELSTQLIWVGFLFGGIFIFLMAKFYINDITVLLNDP